MTSWYPNLRHLDSDSQSAIRRILDFIYELRDQLSPHAILSKSDLDFTISTTRAPIPGCHLTFPRSGTWLVTSITTITIDSDADKLFTVSLRIGAIQHLPQARLLAADLTVSSISQQWLVTVEQGQTASLEIVKESTASGTSITSKEHCTLSATWHGSAA